ncbi:glycosyltransferase family 4 protein [Desulforhopalus sp. IMCC35007]|uniref:glycosyltransferase family 4 protein n=1 Tax=Desulforhopalus sp. IMCC35007 TaxID=2569543 RepID=UPI0010AEB105|nr:glycosyltransferase family 4 protein [Desulforhopalus sp. IMCC35007]TKB07609.1 glycosyltransferase family 4 protein [Desulforhopalus sp. IMCC35007]
MKILVIAPQPFFTPRGTPFSVYYRTLVTSQLDNNIDLLTYGQGKDVAIPNLRIIRIPGFSKFGTIKVGPSAYKLFLDVFMVAYATGLLLTNSYDVVHAHEEAVFFCRFLKPIFRFKLVYDMHSSLPQQLTNFEFTKSKLLIRMFKFLEDSCLKKADAIITICPDLAGYVGKLLNNPKKHFLIENSIFEPIRLKSIDDNTDITTDNTCPLAGSNPYIIYAGTLEAYQGIDILIPAFKIFQAQHPDYRLVIVGGNAKQVQLYKNLAQEVGITDSCIFTGQVSQAEAKQYCSCASILVSPRKSGTNTPLKVYEQIASGIPLVATRIYSHTQVLDDNVAFLVDPSPESMAEGLAAATKEDGRDKAENAKSLYVEKYSRDAYLEKMQNLFGHLQSHPRV